MSITLTVACLPTSRSGVATAFLMSLPRFWRWTNGARVIRGHESTLSAEIRDLRRGFNQCVYWGKSVSKDCPLKPPRGATYKYLNGHNVSTHLRTYYVDICITYVGIGPGVQDVIYHSCAWSYLKNASCHYVEIVLCPTFQPVQVP